MINNKTGKQPTQPKFFSRLTRFWNKLTSAHPGIKETGERQQAQLAAAISLGLAVFTLFGAAGGLMANARVGNSILLLSIALLVVVLYAVNRSKYFKLGSAALVLIFVLAGYVLARTEPGRESFALYSMLPIALIMGSLLLPLWGLAVMTGLNFLAVIVLPSILSTYKSSDAITDAGIFLTLGILLIIAVAYRNSVERLRVAEVTTVNRELQAIQNTLEQHVAARTKDLATVAEVGTATAAILDPDRLLQEVVDLTKDRFNLYHSHIYLLDEAGENLVLTSGAGEPGRRMVAEKRSIPLKTEQSLVARAARERKGVTVNDVTQAPDFLPNPLLPDTRSELAVPMVAGGNLIGVFDIQSDQVGRFADSDVNIQTTLAAQVATSIQNVRSFAQSKRQAELESLVNAIGQKIQRTISVEDTLQTAIREIGLALGVARVKVSLQASHPGGDGRTSISEVPHV